MIAEGHSQGGVISRGVIESWHNHNVDTFIGLATPQHGVANIPYTDDFIDRVVKDEDLNSKIKNDFDKIRDKITLDWVLQIFEPWQKLVLGLAPLNYFFDPTNYELYCETINFFPDINNERGDSKSKLRRKRNFLRQRRMVLIGGPQDVVVVPWQSNHFGFFDENGYAGHNVINMTETRYYTEDLFGLRTLDQRGGVTLYTVENVGHRAFANDPGVLNDYVLPTINEVIDYYADL